MLFLRSRATTTLARCKNNILSIDGIASRAISTVALNRVGGNSCSSSSGAISPSSSSGYGHRVLHRMFTSHEVNQTPSSKTSILLRDIGMDSTLESLKGAISAAEVDYRKIEVQPGCSLHFQSEAEADYVSEMLTNSMQLDCTVSRTSIPTVLVQNFPESNSSIQQLREKVDIHTPNWQMLVTKTVQPVNISTQGKPMFQITFNDAAKVLHAAKKIKTGAVTLDGHNLQCNSFKVDEKYVVQVYDLPPSCDMEEAKKSLESLGGDDIFMVDAAIKSLTLRVVPKTGTDRSVLKAKVQEIVSAETASNTNTISDVQMGYKKPSIFLRKLGHCSEGTVENLLTEYGASKVTMVRYGNEVVKPDFAVAYFDTEGNALDALKKLKGVMVDGRKISSSYKETSEPACQISNLPKDTTEKSLKKILLKDYRLRPLHIEIRDEDKIGRTAYLILESPKEIERAKLAFKKKRMIGKNNLKFLGPIDNDDVSVTLASSTNDISEDVVQKIILAINGLEDVDNLEESKWKSNLSATLSFRTLYEANILQTELAAGHIDVGGDDGSKVSSKVIGMPSFAIEVEGYSPDQPASSITNMISEDDNVDVLRASRSAIVKFRKHAHAYIGMMQLKSITLENGMKLKPVKFMPQALSGQSEYDVAGEYEEFDYRENVNVLKDFLHADPATRYQVAKNQFETAFKNAQIYGDISFLCDDDAPKHIKQELENILKPFVEDLEKVKLGRKDKQKSYLNIPDQKPIRADGSNEALQRAFAIFNQRKEMLKFTHDFDEMHAILGPADSSDAFNWSEFRMEDVQDVKRLEEEMKDELEALRAVEEETAMGIGMSISGGSVGKSYAKLERQALKELEEKKKEEEKARLSKLEDAHSEFPLEDHEDVDLNDESAFDGKDDITAAALRQMGVGTEPEPEPEITVSNGEKDEVISLEDINQVIDREGRVWSGVILDTDIVQKTMPGGRVMSHRCLVMVGNLRGAGGFGIGKGDNPQAALRNAFREALRNLLFIDLYDNASLAHDLYGKHNSCHAYIKATPASRIYVASPFAIAVLKRFGIASASCKLIGRRNPYSMVRALFNALEKHENLDETAKARGLRYLTLQWAYDHNVGGF